jgi:bifunctional N-acetylglucosamine-1-phosphate-uridyltransferase/glucosamine-1-phosphate-acetyltransferase GlmU-like protein
MTVAIIIADFEEMDIIILKVIIEMYAFVGNDGRILIVVGKNREIIETVIQDNLESNILSIITYVVQNVPKGTGHGVICCLPYFKPNDMVLIVTGPFFQITADDMRKLAKYPVGKERIAIMATRMENPCGYARVIYKNKIVKIIEDADCDDRERCENIVNCGVYFGLGEMLMRKSPFFMSGINSKYNFTNITNFVVVDVFESSCEIHKKPDILKKK